MFFVAQPRQSARIRLISSAWVRLMDIFFMDYPISASNMAKSPKFSDSMGNVPVVYRTASIYGK
jgi:hypothetical protein